MQKSKPTATAAAEIFYLDKNGRQSKQDALAVEDPLEIRISFTDGQVRLSQSVAITMRTPGQDKSLAAGFLFTEGIIKHPRQISSIRAVEASHSAAEGNVVEVELEAGVKIDFKKLQRHFYTSSSCGVCGKASFDAVKATASFNLFTNKLSIPAATLFQLPETLYQHQNIFTTTGGIHAAAIFDTQGVLQLMQEDVGRHNALDKLIGAALREGRLPLSDAVLLVSGRASFELVQKAWMAGIPVIAAVGAPSSLAVTLARQAGMTLVGFLRDGRANIYSFNARVVSAPTTT